MLLCLCCQWTSDLVAQGSTGGSLGSGIDVNNRGQIRFYRKSPTSCSVKLTISYEVLSSALPACPVQLHHQCLPFCGLIAFFSLLFFPMHAVGPTVTASS